MKQSLVTLFVIANLTSDSAAEDFARFTAADRAQAQLSICEAFYLIKSECTKDQGSAQKLSVIEQRAKTAANITPLSEADAALRLELNLAKQRSLIQDRCEDVGTLQERYGVDCDPLATP